MRPRPVRPRPVCPRPARPALGEYQKALDPAPRRGDVRSEMNDHPLTPPPPASPASIAGGAFLLVAAFGITGLVAFFRVILGLFD